MRLFFFFFNDTATTEIYTLSLHDALPISASSPTRRSRCSTCWRSTFPPSPSRCRWPTPCWRASWAARRSEEHTSELQSRQYLVCRLLLEKKKHNLTLHLNPYAYSHHLLLL